MLSDAVRRIIYRSLQTTSYPSSRYTIINKLYWEPDANLTDLDKNILAVINPSALWNSDFLVIDKKPILNKAEPRITCVNVIAGSAGDKDVETGHFNGRYNITADTLKNMYDDKMLFSNCLVGKYGHIQHAASAIVFFCAFGKGKDRKFGVSTPQPLNKYTKITFKEFANLKVAEHYRHTGKDLRKIDPGWIELSYLPKYADITPLINPYIWDPKGEYLLSLWYGLKYVEDNAIASTIYPSGWLDIPSWKEEVTKLDSSFNRAVGVAMDDLGENKKLITTKRTVKDIEKVYKELVSACEPFATKEQIIAKCIELFPDYTLFPEYTWYGDACLYFAKKEMIHCSQLKNE